MIDSRINLAKAAKELGGGHSILMRKKKFPFPVKLHGLNYSNKTILENVSEAVKGSHVLLGGGKEFCCQAATTESLSVKDSVKNVVRAVLGLVCIVIFAQEK